MVLRELSTSRPVLDSIYETRTANSVLDRIEFVAHGFIRSRLSLIRFQRKVDLRFQLIQPKIHFCELMVLVPNYLNTRMLSRYLNIEKKKHSTNQYRRQKSVKTLQITQNVFKYIFLFSQSIFNKLISRFLRNKALKLYKLHKINLIDLKLVTFTIQVQRNINEK